jgi:uncharacterized membrane protein YfcA
MDLERLPLALLAAAAGGAVNAVAGGGTLLTFPAIVGLGLDPRIANATSTVALWPGALSSMWGYRGELRGTRRWLGHFTAPSLLGGAVGAWLLLVTSPDAFAHVVPFLVFGATLLFLVQRPLLAWVRGHGPVPAPPGPAMPLPAFYAAQFGVGVY